MKKCKHEWIRVRGFYALEFCEPYKSKNGVVMVDMLDRSFPLDVFVCVTCAEMKLFAAGKEGTNSFESAIKKVKLKKPTKKAKPKRPDKPWWKF